MHGKTIILKIVSIKPILVIAHPTRYINVLIITFSGISITNTKIAMIMHVKASLVSIFSISQALFVVTEPVLERCSFVGTV